MFFCRKGLEIEINFAVVDGDGRAPGPVDLIRTQLGYWGDPTKIDAVSRNPTQVNLGPWAPLAANSNTPFAVLGLIPVEIRFIARRK